MIKFPSLINSPSTTVLFADQKEEIVDVWPDIISVVTTEKAMCGYMCLIENMLRNVGVRDVGILGSDDPRRDVHITHDVTTSSPSPGFGVCTTASFFSTVTDTSATSSGTCLLATSTVSI